MTDKETRVFNRVARDLKESGLTAKADKEGDTYKVTINQDFHSYFDSFDDLMSGLWMITDVLTIQKNGLLNKQQVMVTVGNT